MAEKIILTKFDNEIIVLGAGASRADKGPKQNELLTTFFRLFKQEEVRRGSPEALLKKYFKFFWNIDIDDEKTWEKTDLPTFEECLGVLDLAYLRRESFRYYASDRYEDFSQKNIQETRTALNYLIAVSLRERLKRIEKKKKTQYEECINGQFEDFENILSADNEKPHRYYHNTLVSKFKNRNINILSLNYDLLIDHALFKEGLIPNYNLHFDKYLSIDEHGNVSKLTIRPSKISLFKLHGSLNWLHCPVCHSRYLTRGFHSKGAYFILKNPEAIKCYICERRVLEPILIPPTFYKDLTREFVQHLLNEFYKVLTEADVIYFCGYSFPDADLHIKYLFKRAEIYQNRKTHPLNIKVFNGKDSNYADQEETRYKRFFRNKHLELEYTGKTFEYFCENFDRIGNE